MGGPARERQDDDSPLRGVLPVRAPVAPRVRPAGGGEVLRLEDRALRLIDSNARGLVNLCGPAGSGKTTALRHLAAVLPDNADVYFVDTGNPPPSQKRRLTFFTSIRPSADSVAEFQMAPWTDDDLIEYLLATNRRACQAVMFKVKSYTHHLSLGGSPDLWSMVLGAMASDDSIADVSAALRRCLAGPLSDPKMSAGSVCLWALRNPGLGALAAQRMHLEPRVQTLVAHNAVQVVLASELIVRELCDGAAWSVLEGTLPHDLIVETARLAAHWPAAAERLAALLSSNKRRVHPMAASLMLAIRPDWRPGAKPIPTLDGAYVPGAHWAGVDLHDAALTAADLDHADLTAANLTGAKAADAVLNNASLRNARLDKLVAVGGKLARAQLTGASADGAKLRGADLHGADLRSASLRGADLTAADLSDAVLTAANLRDAVLDHTTLAGADLVGTNFTEAILHHVRLSDANCSATCFRRADLRSCDLEGLSVPGVDFSGAKLRGCYLTGAVMPKADFQQADLRDTGLADVQWEHADLRDADLRGASFHMGSTRSGLVGAAAPGTPPCEGSRTGFYTDDFSDREFKNPEEIRKANLCHADLRGAKTKGVDFYLVDLRGARYTDAQRTYFRRCGAILD